MGRPPCCDKANVKRGLWTAEEDAKILVYVSKHGTGNWTLVPKKAGLNRCGKSCRLRWTNYLRPDLKHDSFSTEEEKLIIHLHQVLGSRWCVIAKHLPGRTDNDVKNYWNTKLRKKLMKMGIDPVTHKPISQIVSDYNYTISTGLPKLSPDQFDTAPTLQSPDTHFNLVGNPSMADQETNTNFYGLPSWNLPQLHSFMNEITSSCLGSPSLSSTTVSTMNLSSQEPTPFVPFQAQMATYPPLSTLPRVSRTFMKTLEPELAQEHGGGLVTPMNQCEVFNSSSSNGDAFVDALLDQDSLIQSEIGELLHGILDD